MSENECEMNRLLLEDVQRNLAEVIANLHPGEVVQIISEDKVVAHLTGEQDIPRRTRQPGSAIGVKGYRKNQAAQTQGWFPVS